MVMVRIDSLLSARLFLAPQWVGSRIYFVDRYREFSIYDVDFVPLGKRRLKGVADEIELFEAVRRSEAAAGLRQVDPVCGMELGPGEPAARLVFAGRERVFCSQGCLQRFVATPERYGG